MLHLRCLLDIEVEIPSRQLDIQVWDSVEVSGRDRNLSYEHTDCMSLLKLCEIIQGVSIDWEMKYPYN